MFILHSLSVDSVSFATGPTLVEVPRRLLLFLLIDPRNLLATTTRLIMMTIMIMFLIIETRLLLITDTIIVSFRCDTDSSNGEEY